jgi:3-hydroxyacyl-CoA dehydrogenase
MGARIAAHFANAGIPSYLLDIVVPNQPNRNAAALKGMESAAKLRPGGFFLDTGASFIKPGNFEDDLDKLSQVDWIIEAVTENLEIKRNLWKKVESVRKPGSIVSTNTSGIPLKQIAEGFSPDFQKNFLGTHFFNPPRYLHLLEIIPGPASDPEVLQFVSEFSDVHLGKGIVPCKDTPNFIANRIGSFFGGTVAKYLVEGDYTIEEVDALTGPLIGLPNSASFRLLDIVGLDVWTFVGKNLYDAVPNDPYRDRFLAPEFHAKMVANGWLGEKSGQGYYKRVGKGENKEIYAIDWKTLEYHPAQKVKFPSTDAAKAMEDLGERLRMLVNTDDRAGRFLWRLFSDSFVYSASMVPEISDRIVEIDNAMKWGYAHKFGPFEAWDAIGFEAVCDRIEKEGRALPESIVKMRKAGAKSLYRHADKNGAPGREYFDLSSSTYKTEEPRQGIIVLSDVKRARGVVKKNAGTSLIDLGDGVLNLEIHSKMNSLGTDQIQMIYEGLAELEKNFDAMVIANQGEQFSVGANLMMLLMAAQDGEWDELNQAIARMQQAYMALKYAPKPVVAAPFSRTLAGGCEMCLHAHRQVASAETYMGLVEVGVGLIPAAGGCKELLMRLKTPLKAFELIGYAKVSSSAAEAQRMGYLSRQDRISMNPERLIGDAKEFALQLAKDYTPGTPAQEVPVMGEPGIAMLKMGVWTARQGNYITDYDVEVAGKLAHVLCGGKLAGENNKVSEQYLLDLEREAFLSLAGSAKTQERIQYMLKNGKPLRN